MGPIVAIEMAFADWPIMPLKWCSAGGPIVAIEMAFRWWDDSDY